MAEYRRFHMGIGGDDSPSPSVSAEFQLAGSYHYQLFWCQIIITGRLCLPVFRVRKSIMYYLKHKLLDVRFILSFTFYHGSLLPVFPIGYMTSTICKSDTGIIFAAISLFRYYSNRCLVCFLTTRAAQIPAVIITGMLVMFAPFFILSSGHCYTTF
ncbi:hypothetical protein [Klebsiella pneumoniae]|uniref:hypothetical protein n=1 Tax=Klebsiella pneumoniae TaxID=573 RepID=UPI003A5CF7F2